MQRLEHAQERLDGPLDDHGAVVANLRDLARANRWFGGAALSRGALLRLASGAYAGPARRRFDWRRGPLRLLDVGTGGGDIPVALLDWAERRTLPLEIEAVDAREEIVAAAADLISPRPGLRLNVAEVTRLPYPDASYDVAHCSLLLHHLEPEQAVVALGEMRRVARLGVIVNDLDRRRLTLLGAWLFGLSTFRRYSRHDAPMSARRAYRPAEVAQLAARAGLVEALRVVGFARHRYAIAFVPVERTYDPDSSGATSAPSSDHESRGAEQAPAARP